MKKILAFCAAVCLVLGIAAIPAGAEPTGTVSYTSAWKDSGTITITVDATTAGTAYYQVLDETDATPSADDIVFAHKTISVSPGSTATKDVSVANTTAKKICIVYEDSDGRYDTAVMHLSAFNKNVSDSANVSPAGAVSFQLARTSDSTASMKVNSNVSGTVHYIVQSASAAAPSQSTVLASSNTVSVTAGSAATATVNVDSSDQKIYLAFDDGTSNNYGLSSADIPAYASGTVNVEAGWNDATSLYLSVTPSATGTMYYKILEDGAAAPTQSEVMSSGSALNCDTANVATTTDVDGVTSTAKDIYMVYVDDNGNLYEMKKVDLGAPASYAAMVDPSSLYFGSKPSGYTTPPKCN
ncbi:MAG: hypothetical protein ACOYCA_04965 [Eggerthellaceae bacterium]|jgi:hypothetical protein